MSGEAGPAAGNQSAEQSLCWHSPEVPPFRLAGFPWHEREGLFRRLPANAYGTVPAAVDELANCTAGGQVSFRSDAGKIAVRVELAGPADMVHMPATGQCGFDLYVGDPPALRYHSTSIFGPAQTAYEALLFEHPERRMRTFVLNFPLYRGVRRALVGVSPDARVKPPFPWSSSGRIVIYGTSITQGGCASRPGMAPTNILSRRLNVEVVNLGFSGSGKGEPEVIGFVAAVPDPLLFVLDYEANAVDGLERTLPEALRILRTRHPNVPLLVVSRIAFARDATHRDSFESREASRDRQVELVADFGKRWGGRVHFLDGSTLLGTDYDECTVDGVHPNDLGFLRIARGMEAAIRDILKRRSDKQSPSCS